MHVIGCNGVLHEILNVMFEVFYLVKRSQERVYWTGPLREDMFLDLSFIFLPPMSLTSRPDANTGAEKPKIHNDV